MSKPNGGPAFPATYLWFDEEQAEIAATGTQAGMSLRDALAMHIDLGSLGSVSNAKFAVALVGEPPHYEEEPEAYLDWYVRFEARIRYAKADAMLAEREKP